MQFFPAVMTESRPTVRMSEPSGSDESRSGFSSVFSSAQLETAKGSESPLAGKATAGAQGGDERDASGDSAPASTRETTPDSGPVTDDCASGATLPGVAIVGAASGQANENQTMTREEKSAGSSISGGSGQAVGSRLATESLGGGASLVAGVASRGAGALGKIVDSRAEIDRGRSLGKTLASASMLEPGSRPTASERNGQGRSVVSLAKSLGDETAATGDARGDQALRVAGGRTSGQPTEAGQMEGIVSRVAMNDAATRPGAGTEGNKTVVGEKNGGRNQQTASASQAEVGSLAGSVARSNQGARSGAATQAGTLGNPGNADSRSGTGAVENKAASGGKFSERVQSSPAAGLDEANHAVRSHVASSGAGGQADVVTSSEASSEETQTMNSGARIIGDGRGLARTREGGRSEDTDLSSDSTGPGRDIPKDGTTVTRAVDTEDALGKSAEQASPSPAVKKSVTSVGNAFSDGFTDQKRSGHESGADSKFAFGQEKGAAMLAEPSGTAASSFSMEAELAVTGQTRSEALAAKADASLARQAEVYKQVENGAFTNLSQGGKQLVIRLDPPELGQVSVILRVHGKEVQAVLRATSPETTQALNEQLGHLRGQLEAQGLRVGKLEVQTQLPDGQTDAQWQGAEQHNESQRNRESAMSSQRFRFLSGSDGSLAQDVHEVSYTEKNSSGGLDLFA